jgi:prepilin-type processing-associated H-X9-DG protein
VYECPSEPSPKNHPRNGAAKLDYAGCHGTFNDGGAGDGNGVFPRRMRTTRMLKITDGTSNTIMVGEMRAWDPVNKHFCFLDSIDWAETNRYFPTWVGAVAEGSNLDDWDAYLRLGSTSRPMNSILRNYRDERGQCFGSLHPGGAQFVFADGTVRFLQESINLTLYQNLCSISDGQTVSLP